MNKSNFLVSASVLSVSLSAAQFSMAGDSVEMVFNSFFPPQHFLTSEAMRSWADEVQEVTEGRVTVSIPPRTAVPPQDIWTAVRRGIVDGGYIFNGWADNRITLPLVGHLPWVSSESAEANSVALWETYEKYFKEVGEYGDVELIGLFMAPGGEVYSMEDSPILSLEDFQSRRTWALSGTTADMLREIDAPIVSGPAVQMHEPVSIGVVDGFSGVPIIDADSFKAISYVKSITRFPTKITAPSFSMFINSRTWEKISDEDQEAIRAISGRALAEAIGKGWDREQAESVERAVGNGVEFIEAPDELYEAMREASEPLVNNWLAEAAALGIDAEAALAFYQERVMAKLAEGEQDE
ncbi:TRAP transporter substrate-binding protein DctP [Halomonas alkalicola]|uniref:TRAP transporter substrate-binding protein DctP n=1 Tax=Halomonas alkalicola TaxID=1930622 RepID=UPI00265FFD8E|nr:TRAP transporter substrate-binding protein DctP [Halomonas alkalicola]